jgi:UDPglucose 6-dehydrogenase
MKVGIVGAGVVGKEMFKLFPNASLYDPAQSLFTLEAFSSDVIFISVPTPCVKEGKLDTSIVEQAISRCHIDSLIVIRSTVNPGFADKMKGMGYRIITQPEYLGETVAHPLSDESQRKFLIIGGEPKDRRQLIELYQEVYNANINIRQVTNLEAEVIKMSANRAVAFKVAECQELYDACEDNGVDYYTIREAVYGDDPRFDLWFSFVYPNQRGFNSKCIPKDVYAWSAWAGKPELTKALLKYNKKLIKRRTK